VIDRFQVVPAAYVLFRRDTDRDGGGQVLLQLRQHTGYMDGFWASGAAGHVEAGESVLAAAHREAVEELGVKIEPADLRPLCAMHRTAGTGPIDARVDFFFECRRWSGEPGILEPDKAADLRWFDLGNLPAPVVPHELVVLASLANGEIAPVVTFGF